MKSIVIGSHFPIKNKITDSQDDGICKSVRSLETFESSIFFGSDLPNNIETGVENEIDKALGRIFKTNLAAVVLICEMT